MSLEMHLAMAHCDIFIKECAHFTIILWFILRQYCTVHPLNQTTTFSQVIRCTTQKQNQSYKINTQLLELFFNLKGKTKAISSLEDDLSKIKLINFDTFIFFYNSELQKALNLMGVIWVSQIPYRYRCLKVSSVKDSLSLRRAFLHDKNMMQDITSLCS